MSKEIVESIKIKLPADWIGPLAEEFKTSKVSVYYSLSYANNSELARKIRAKAKEMLEAAANNIND